MSDNSLEVKKVAADSYSGGRAATKERPEPPLVLSLSCSPMCSGAGDIAKRTSNARCVLPGVRASERERANITWRRWLVVGAIIYEDRKIKKE
jgi:hypothetical protein